MNSKSDKSKFLKMNKLVAFFVLVTICEIKSLPHIGVHPGYNQQLNHHQPMMPTSNIGISNANAGSLSMQGPPGFGQSSSHANANAFNQQQRPHGFGSQSAMASAQGFRNQNIGASATNAATQSMQVGPHGMQGGASMSGTQTYNMPNGHDLNVAYSMTQSMNNGQPTAGNSFSVTTN